MSHDPEALSRVEQIVAESDLPEGLKQAYLGMAMADPWIFAGVGSSKLALGLEREGPEFLIGSDGKLKGANDPEFDVNPATVQMAIAEYKERTFSRTLKTGDDLLKAVLEGTMPSDESYWATMMCESLSIKIKEDFINAIARQAPDNRKLPHILQELVDSYTQSPSHGPDDVRRRQQADHYILKSLDWKLEGREKSHPASDMLFMVLESLGRQQHNFQVERPCQLPTNSVHALAKPKTLDEKLAEPLTDKQQDAADAIKDRLFGPGWRDKEGRNPTA